MTDITGNQSPIVIDVSSVGIQGSTGPAGQITDVSATSLSAGATPTVVNNGSGSAAQLVFGIPKGDKGDIGNTGQGYTQKGVYSASTAYVPYDVVYYGGTTYVCKTATQAVSPTSTTYWTKMATGLTPLGAYSSGQTYNAGDVVGSQGSSYVCLADGTIGRTPSNATYWGVIATKGDTGAIGATGAVGPVSNHYNPPAFNGQSVGVDVLSRLVCSGNGGVTVGTFRATTFLATDTFTASSLYFYVSNAPVFNTAKLQFVLCSYDLTGNYFIPKATSGLTGITSLTSNANNVVTLTALTGENTNIVSGNWYAIACVIPSGGSFTTAPTFQAATVGNTALMGGTSNGIQLGPWIGATGPQTTLVTDTTPLTATAGIGNPYWYRITV